MQLVHLVFSRPLSPPASPFTVFFYAVSTSQVSVKNTAEEILYGGENNPSLKNPQPGVRMTFLSILTGEGG